MERDFYNEDLEQLLKEKADQYKLYPSDKVWKNIHRSLHTRRKWYWFSFVLFLSGIAWYAIEALITPSTGKQVAADLHPSSSPAATSVTKRNEATVIPFASGKQQPGSGVAVKQNTFVSASHSSITATVTLNEVLANKILMADEEPTQTARVYDLRTGRERALQHQVKAVADDKINTVSADENNQPSFVVGKGHENSAPSTVPDDIARLATMHSGISEDSKGINWLQEFAIHDLAVPKLKRLSWQLAFAPTMNYRKLTGRSNANMQNDVKNIPLDFTIEGDPDKLVNHKPALGFELGSHFLYAVNKDLSLRAGLQFNYSRYDIQAYSAPTERATIALNSTTPSIAGESLTSLTRIRNFGGDATEDLMNQYFQFSLPLGFEFRVVGGQKLYIGLAGTIQPTYLLNRNTYLITTDYKNYTKEPSLVRRWNFNTGAEAFVAYKTGDLKWQVGPQFRYQLLSGYVKEYPIREQLMEYGIKIAVTKTIR
jgi:hypothetical protein